MTVSEIADQVRIHFVEHASSWSLRPQAIRVDYVPSPGGFGPINFAVLDGCLSYHVKLNRSAEKLSAWIRNAERLASRYRAPRFLAEVRIGDRFGAVFERLPGQNPSQSPPQGLLREVVSLLDALHQDSELARQLEGGAHPARKTLLDYHIAMCDSDLDEIEPALPLPFVDRALGAWMRDETHALRERGLASLAFDELVSSPIHGDLWFGNLLVGDDRWWIIDWDDLNIGDPAHDLSLILFTALDRHTDPSSWLRKVDTALLERFRLYARAALLTFVIDPVADWIEAEKFPQVRFEARAHRQALHSWALERYRSLYAGVLP